MSAMNCLHAMRLALLCALTACTSSGGTSNTTDGGGGGTCTTANIVASPGLEGCFQCMQQRCCAELQACDGDDTCVHCSSTAGQTDTARCVDGTTFEYYPPSMALARCQTQNCVPPCGVSGGSTCTPGDCAATCSNFSVGCR